MKIGLLVPFLSAVQSQIGEMARPVAFYRLITTGDQISRARPRSGRHAPNLSALSMERSFESRVRARLTRLLIVPTALSQIAAASS